MPDDLSRQAKAKPPAIEEVLRAIPVTPDVYSLAIKGGFVRAERRTYGLGYWPPAAGDIVTLSDPTFLRLRPRSK